MISDDPSMDPTRPSWLLVLAIGLALGGTALAAAVATDTREFAAHHGALIRTCAL